MLTNYSICWHSNWSKAIWQASRYGWFIFSIFQLNSQCQSDQCWRKFATLAIFYKYLVILLGLVSIWQHFEYTLAIFFLGVGQNFIVVKVQILKNDLTIWSHCSKCLKGICFKVAFTLRQIKLRKMFDFCWIFFYSIGLVYRILRRVIRSVWIRLELSVFELTSKSPRIQSTLNSLEYVLLAKHTHNGSLTINRGRGQNVGTKYHVKQEMQKSSEVWWLRLPVTSLLDSSVTRLGDFWKFLVTNFLQK